MYIFEFLFIIIFVFFRSIAAGLWRFAVAQSPQGLFISFARTKETKQRKFAVCTFWATLVSVSAKQKELASLKQLFVFNAPTLTSASRPKSEAGPSYFLLNIASLVGSVCVLFASLIFLFTSLFIVFFFAVFPCHPERNEV